MGDIQAAFSLAANLILSGDSDLFEIVGLSLSVSVTAVAIACAIGMTLGAVVAVTRFPCRGAIIVLLNALMGLPPVVVGLAVYLILSRAGPLGVLITTFTDAGGSCASGTAGSSETSRASLFLAHQGGSHDIWRTIHSR